MEPEKCNDLTWFALDALPANTTDYVQQAIELHLKGEFYLEFGW